MSSHSYTVENLMSTFPYVLQHDPQMLAMGKTIATLMVRYRADLESALHILTNIDNLPEDVLDSLAYDFKVDWYNYDYLVNVKRALLKTSPYVHRHLGTRAAVETAVHALYPDSILEEWYEYGGDPYHFRIIVDVTKPSENKAPIRAQEDILRWLYTVKRGTAWLDEIAYILRHLLVYGSSHKAWNGFAPFTNTFYCGTWPEFACRGYSINRPLQFATANTAMYNNDPPECGNAICGNAWCGGKNEEVV